MHACMYACMHTCVYIQTCTHRDKLMDGYVGRLGESRWIIQDYVDQVFKRKCNIPLCCGMEVRSFICHS